MNFMKRLKFLKLLGRVYAVWPSDQDTSKIWKYIHQILWCFYFINVIFAIFFTMNACYESRYNIEIFTFSWMELMAYLEVFIILIDYKCYENLLQSLLSKIEIYISAVDRDSQLHLKKKALIITIMMVLILQLFGIITVLAFAQPPIVTWDKFLTTAYYPPSIRSPAADVLILIHQLASMFHTSVMMVFDIMIVTLIFGCTVSFKLLAKQFREAHCYEQLVDCIREHQECLRMAEKTNRVARFVALKNVLCFIGYSVGAGLQIINPKATIVSLERFGIVLLVNSIRLIMIALSADDMSTSSEEIGVAVYSTSWYKDDKKSIIAKKFIMLRSQKIVKVSVSGIMTVLSLSYITGIISTAISYFTALSAVT